MRLPKVSTLEKWEKDYIKNLIAIGRNAKSFRKDDDTNSGFYRGVYYGVKSSLDMFLFNLWYKGE